MKLKLPKEPATSLDTKLGIYFIEPYLKYK